jgi:hypothetical protein
MPLTRLSAPRHIPLAQLQQLAAAVQDALVDCCQVPRDDLFQLMARFDAGEMVMDPHFGGVSRSADACIVEIVFLQGRTDEQKRNLFGRIAAGAEGAGWRQDDVLVALVENTRMDWSLGRGAAYADHAGHADHAVPAAGAAAGGDSVPR